MGLGYKEVSHSIAGSGGKLIQCKVTEFPSTMINPCCQEKGKNAFLPESPVVLPVVPT